MSTEARWLIRDVDRRVEGERVSSSVHFSPERPRKLWTTARTTMLRQWGPHHCVATGVPHSCCFNCCAGQSQRQCPLNRCWGTTCTNGNFASEPSSTSLLQNDCINERLNDKEPNCAQSFILSFYNLVYYSFPVCIALAHSWRERERWCLHLCMYVRTCVV